LAPHERGDAVPEQHEPPTPPDSNLSTAIAGVVAVIATIAIPIYFRHVLARASEHWLRPRTAQARR